MRNEQQPIVPTVVQRSLRHALYVVGVLALTCARVDADSRVESPLWREVKEADVIVVGTITEVRDQGADNSVGTFAVLEVIRGDPTLKTVEVPFPLSHNNMMGVFKNQAGVWLLMKRPTFEFAMKKKEFTSFVKIVAAGKKDDSVLDLFGTSDRYLDSEIVEYASSINLKSPAAIRTASRALASSLWHCRRNAANWLAAAVTTPADAKTALPALIEAASRTEEINKGGNAIARVWAYEAIRSILLRMGATNAEKLPEWRGAVEREVARRSLEGSETATARVKSEAVIHRACDLAKHFLRISPASPESEDR